MRNFYKYKVWEVSHSFVLEIYKKVKTFPKDEIFNLTSQIKRSAVSVPTNISEGAGRISDSDFSRFLGISYGSANEVEYLLLLAKDLGFIDNSDYESLVSKINEIKKMLFALINKLNADSL